MNVQNVASVAEWPPESIVAPGPVCGDLATLSGDLNASDIEPMTDEEWELHNLEAACEAGNEMWSAVLRAMYRDTRHVPAQYALACRDVRRALDTVAAMAKERGGEEA